LILTAVAPRPVGGAEVRQVEAQDGRPAVPAVLKALKAVGVASVLIEG
jgi:diaminohydroxyphosphoribosylaminopyrimidine deaminase/5-amino-6-(5-phosphoribosylamino)uracil reductase